jgi:hypothetical protein
MFRKFVVAVLAAVPTAAQWPNVCISQGYSSWNETSCDTSATCCPSGFSVSGFGCCPLENAVCCPGGYTCCPTGSTCVLASGSSWSAVYNCTINSVVVDTANSVCKPGPALPMSNTLKNVLIIGDSVSIGYTPYVAQALADVALVQHAPWDVSDGGAEETQYGLRCLKYFLHSPSGMPIKPDVIMFNWGLHDGPLGNTTIPGQQGNTTVYAAELNQIAQQIKYFADNSSAKVIFALTSPMLCNLEADGCVLSLNNIARQIMQTYDIPTIVSSGPRRHSCAEGAFPVH